MIKFCIIEYLSDHEIPVKVTPVALLKEREFQQSY